MTKEQRDEAVKKFCDYDYLARHGITPDEWRVVSDKLRSLLAMEAKALQVYENNQNCECGGC